MDYNKTQIHVLIADDSETVCNLIKKFLKDSYIVHQARDGDEAWQLIQDNEKISLVFSDLHMPVMNGMQLLKHIRSSKINHIANLPVIIITGHEDNEAAKKACFAMGATDFVCKPFTEVDVITRANSYTKLNQKISRLENNFAIEANSDVLNNAQFQRSGEKLISSAYRYNNDLSMLIMQTDNLPLISKQYGSKITEQIIKGIIKKLSKSLRKEEDLALLDEGRIAIILPMTKAFKAHIVAMRFKTALDKTVFQLKNESIRVNLAIGLNSIENHKSHLSFSNFKDETERALESALRTDGKQITRYDDIMTKEPNVDISAANAMMIPDCTNKNEKSDSDMNSEPNQIFSDIETFSGYMPELIKGDYKDIPSRHIEGMITALTMILKEIGVKKETVCS